MEGWRERAVPIPIAIIPVEILSTGRTGPPPTLDESQCQDLAAAARDLAREHGLDCERVQRVLAHLVEILEPELVQFSLMLDLRVRSSGLQLPKTLHQALKQLPGDEALALFERGNPR